MNRTIAPNEELSMGITEPALRRAQEGREPGEPWRELDFSALGRAELDPRHLARHHVIRATDRSRAAEAFKMLRTRVKAAMEAQGFTTLAVSSAAPDEGKSLVAVNLAFRMAASANAEIVLADFDLRRPSVSKLLGLDPRLPGLPECLGGEATLEEVCVCPGAERLAILPNTTEFDHSSEVLSSDAMTALVAELRGRNPARKVIFDLPPLLSMDDFLAFSRHVDALLLVVCEAQTKRSELTAALDLLDGVNIIGTVLNKSTGRADAYYY